MAVTDAGRLIGAIAILPRNVPVERQEGIIIAGTWLPARRVMATTGAAIGVHRTDRADQCLGAGRHCIVHLADTAATHLVRPAGSIDGYTHVAGAGTGVTGDPCGRRHTVGIRLAGIRTREVLPVSRAESDGHTIFHDCAIQSRTLTLVA